MLDTEGHAFQDLAQEWARNQARFDAPGNVETWTGIAAFTLMLHLGGWKIMCPAFDRD